tara:strand:- start:288 stop:512 length:225 start_codon:yes stop_codon:yes gene_type:complete
MSKSDAWYNSMEREMEALTISVNQLTARVALLEKALRDARDALSTQLGIPPYLVLDMPDTPLNQQSKTSRRDIV